MKHNKSATSWKELTITCPADLREAVTAVLFERGCLGISEEYDTMHAYFSSDTDMGALSAAVYAFKGVTFSRSDVAEQDWHAGWKKTIGPYRVAGLLICPPWKKDVCVPAEGESLVILDPGQAFGTGDHESTTAVLMMLSSWSEKQTGIASKRVLDLGTGTGILSIAAWSFGVRDITAVDIEPKAVETAARNFELNGLTKHIRLIQGSVDDAGGGYDLVLANIFQEVLLDVMPYLAKALNPGGEAVMAGLLSGQEHKVIRSAEAHGLRFIEKAVNEDWICLRLSA
jgi:ribosomal protein L11 methyltransferase